MLLNIIADVHKKKNKYIIHSFFSYAQNISLSLIQITQQTHK